ncbi:MAG: hypothetical protein ACI4PM_06235 [Butyricicoccus sp.]
MKETKENKDILTTDPVGSETGDTKPKKWSKASIRSAVTTVLLAIIVFLIAYTFFTYLMV